MRKGCDILRMKGICEYLEEKENEETDAGRMHTLDCRACGVYCGNELKRGNEGINEDGRKRCVFDWIGTIWSGVGEEEKRIR